MIKHDIVTELLAFFLLFRDPVHFGTFSRAYFSMFQVHTTRTLLIAAADAAYQLPQKQAKRLI